MTIVQRWKQTSIHNKLLVGTSVLVAMSTVLYAGAAIFQVRIMKKSAEASERQLERLTGATNAAITAAVHAEQEATREALKNSQESFSASLKATLSQAKQSLDVSRRAFRVEQRPYVVLDAPYFVEGFGPKLNGTVKAGIRPKNVGKSPAIETVNFLRFVRWRLPPNATVNSINQFSDVLFEGLNTQAASEITSERVGSALGFKQDLVSGSDVFSTAELEGGPLSAEDMTLIENGTLILAFGSLAVYTDSDHTTTYKTEACSLFWGKEPVWHFCPGHNIIR